MIFDSLVEPIVFNPRKEREFLETYFSTVDNNKKDAMFSAIYEHCKNMFFRELGKNYTNSNSIQDYESNFKIEFLKAMKSYSPDKGARFTTYLFTKIRLSIQKTNKEEMLYSVKEYKLNILNIYKGKIVNYISHRNGISKDLISDSDFQIENLENIDLRHIYDEMYREYSLPKVKFETLLEDLPNVFSNRIGTEGENGNDITDYVDTNNRDNTIKTRHIDVYFWIHKIFKDSKGDYKNIYIKLFNLGFNLRFRKNCIDNFMHIVSEGGQNVVHYLEDSMTNFDVIDVPVMSDDDKNRLAIDCNIEEIKEIFRKK